ncbi:hypothetical protein AWC38_SpisGene5115 [Stylophora pistillata]|uniref:Endonuclease/exonuclease/phosphatase domain-containing protein n=1 Tax=Stylophora pistillata TaxID=50429 RepID=A0A2B4SLY6_STYPI|nr:hypothetical protein AWC38_SpisGene5115 [Stylophora pistillata]
MGNVSTQLQFFGSLSSCLHRQNYMRSSKKANLGRRALYYSNSTATTQLLLLKLSGNVESNPGPQGPQGGFNSSSKTLCSYCAKTMRRNQNGVRCSSCPAVFNIKCTKMSKNELSCYRRKGTWYCFSCTMPQFSDGFFDDLSPSAACDSSSTGEVFQIAEEHSGHFVDCFFRNVNGYCKSNLKMGHMNINSLQNKLEEVKYILNKCLFDIFFISETKLDGTTSDSFLQQPGHRTIRRDRKKGAGSLIAFVREDIPVCGRRNLEPESVESLCPDVMDSKTARFIVCACYRSPKFCKITDFLSSLTSAIELMNTSRQEILLIGDFNMDLLVGEHGVDAEDNSLMDLCDSDQDLIYAVRKNKLPRAKAQEIEYRSMRQIDIDKFLNDLKTVRWSSAYIYDNVDDLWHHWAQLYTEVLDKHAPIKKKRVRGDQLPWITPFIQREISRRTRLFKKHAKSPTTTSWEEFKKQRNKVTSLKRKGFKAFCMEASSNTKYLCEFWNKLRPLLPSKEKRQSKISLIENESVITDSLIVAEMFNNYFCEVSRSDGDSKEMVEVVDHPCVNVIAEKTCDDVFDLVPVEINAAKTQAIAIGPSTYQYHFHLNDSNVHTKDTLKILGVVLDSKLTFKAHIKQQLNMGCAKASALRRIRQFISKDVLVRLYKAYVLPHLEYCSPLLQGVAHELDKVNKHTERSLVDTPEPASSQMTHMFTPLLGEMKTMNANFSFCAREEGSEVSESEDNDDADPTVLTGAVSDLQTRDDTEDSLRQLIASASGPSEGANISNDVLKDIAQDLNAKETTEPAIHEELAKIFQTPLNEKMSDEKFKSKVENMCDQKLWS